MACHAGRHSLSVVATSCNHETDDGALRRGARVHMEDVHLHLERDPSDIISSDISGDVGHQDCLGTPGGYLLECCDY